MAKTLQEDFNDALEIIRKQAVYIEQLESIIRGAGAMMADLQSRQMREAAPVQQEQLTQWAQVTQVEADSFYSKTSNSRRAMWRLRTSDGRQANVFDHTDPLRDSKPMLKVAGYYDLFDAMVAGQVDVWNSTPIEIELIEDGTWWKVKRFKHRLDGAGPDVDETPYDDSEDLL